MLILSDLRMMESGNLPVRQECRDDDFQRVLSMIGVLVRYSGHVFSQLLAHSNSVKPKDKKEKFLEMLPERFTRQDYLDMSTRLLIQERTADRYIVTFCEKGLVFKEKHGLFTNLTLPQTNKDE